MDSRLGVRARTTIGAITALSVVLVLAGLFLTQNLRYRIESLITEAAEDRAQLLAESLHGNSPQNPLPGGNLDLFAQVVNGEGQVIATDPLLSDLAAFPVTSAGAAGLFRLDSLAPGGPPDLDTEGPYLVAVRVTQLAEGPGLVLVGASLEDAGEAVAAAIPPLLVGGPILLALAGSIVWMVSGRALNPVDKLRITAATISDRSLDQRLPVPRANDEIRGLALTLNHMLGRLEESVLRQRRFVADASHELKSPLASLRTMVEVSAADIPRQLLNDITAELSRMERLTANLLYLAQTDELGPRLRHEVLDLAGLAREEGARWGGVDTTGLQAVSVGGDRDRLGQMIRNLVDNAALHGGGGIWLTSNQHEEEAALLVSDDGNGIPESDWETVFERFVRLDPSRSRRTGGTGLGLAVARSIARSHGGDVQITEPLRGGCTVEVRLPAATPP